MNDDHDNEQTDREALARHHHPSNGHRDGDVQQLEDAAESEGPYPRPDTVLGTTSDGGPITQADVEAAVAAQSAAQSAQVAEMERQIAEIDEDLAGVPSLSYMPLMPFWALEAHMMAGKPHVTVTVVHPAMPNGFQFTLDRDRALKFASQVRRLAQEGPQRIVVAKPKLILPGQ